MNTLEKELLLEIIKFLKSTKGDENIQKELFYMFEKLPTHTRIEIIKSGILVNLKKAFEKDDYTEEIKRIFEE